MDAETSQLEYVMRVLRAFDDCESHEDLHWRFEPENRVRFWVLCNDFFWWGTADGEDITTETIPVLEQAVKDAKAVDCEFWAGQLYCARIRQLRPQGACYRSIPLAIRPLFDACGPQREKDFGNPYSQDQEYGAKVYRP